MSDLYMGIDLGGSHISSWLFDKDGKNYGPFLKIGIIGSKLAPTELLDYLEELVKDEQFIAQSHGHVIRAVGLAGPGPLDPNAGIIISPPNLPNITNLEVARTLQERIGYKIFLINDADAAVFGEHWFGSAKGYDNVVLLALGTGVGSGVIADGKLQRGRGMGGEWGHTAIASVHNPGNRMCSCGRLNCLEAFCGTEGLAKTYCNIFMVQREDLSPDFVQEISKHMRKQADYRWLHLFNAYCSDLTGGIINIINAHHPECIILGGGIACDVMVERIKELLVDIAAVGLYKLAVMFRGVAIKLASNPNSGVAGAAKYAMDCHDIEVEKHRAKHGVYS